MAVIYVNAGVSARRGTSARFLVDTRATYAIVPPTMALNVGAIPSANKFRVTLADGTTHNLKACTMGVEVCGRRAPATALLLARGEPSLGLLTLEALGLRLNPVTRIFEPTRTHTTLL